MVGWIKVHRTILEKSWSNKPDFVALWVYLLLHASHEKREYFWNGKTIILNPGQFVTGRLKMAVNTGIQESKVERILKCFESEQQIEQQKSPSSRLISILNWVKYQESEQPFEQLLNNERKTTEQRLNTKQELKKDKNNDINARLIKFVDFVNLSFGKKYRAFDKIKSAFKQRIEIDQYSVEEIKQVIENLKTTQHHIDNNFKYCTPEFILRTATIEKYKGSTTHKSEAKKPDYTKIKEFYDDLQKPFLKVSK